MQFKLKVSIDIKHLELFTQSIDQWLYILSFTVVIKQIKDVAVLV